MLFSLVIPACNVEKYIRKTIASIRAQSFRDFEAFVIVEESSDGTLNTVRAAAGDDPRFAVVRLERSGSASVGRNYGMTHASGEWLLFVDGDDWIEPDALEKLSGAVSPELDVVACEARYWRETAEGIREVTGRPCHRDPGKIFSGPAFLEKILREGTYAASTWRNIYRRNLLLENHLFQAPGRRHQDDEWTYRVIYAAGKVFVSGIVWYDYLKRADSVTTDHSEKSLSDVACNLRSAFEFWNGHSFPSGLAAELAGLQFQILRRCYFSPSWAALYPRAGRRKAAAEALFTRSSFRAFCTMWPYVKNKDKLFSLTVPLFLILPPCFMKLEDFFCSRLFQYKKAKSTP